MIKLLRLLYTVRYLKLVQITYRIYYRLREPKLYNNVTPVARGKLVGWNSPAYMLPATVDGRNFTFLGINAEFDGDWNSKFFPKLWLYNLHYHDVLNAIDSEYRISVCKSLIDSWIDKNPPMLGNGWEPYCISLRVVNWVKWLSRLKPEERKPIWVDSLASQVSALEQQLEYHILANHLFANAKALVFAGVYFGGQQGDHWLQKGLRLLDKELQEQFLADGAHYELSPMYHAILLWDMADLICLQKNSGLPDLSNYSVEWQRYFSKGLQWLQMMVHPDQDLSFFNDATLGISPTLENLITYAKHLGLNVPAPTTIAQLQGALLGASGYAVIDWSGNHRLIADVAKIGPDYQPGHAHADTLSCEFSLFGKRVLVNSGISQYGEDAERHRQRSTAAHNTLEINGENSSEVWAGFRVARRAKPFGVSMQVKAEFILLKASHDGYRRFNKNVIHEREWLAEIGSLTIIDTLTGSYMDAVAYWHLHPEIELIQLEYCEFLLRFSQGQEAELKISGAVVEVVEGKWHPGFGQSVTNTTLMLKLSEPILKTQIKWSAD